MHLSEIADGLDARGIATARRELVSQVRQQRARALSFKRCRSSQAAPLTRNVLVRAQRRFAKMSLLFLDHFRKRPPAPDFQETVKAPRVLFDFVAKRARSYRAYRA